MNEEEDGLERNLKLALLDVLRRKYVEGGWLAVCGQRVNATTDEHQEGVVVLKGARRCHFHGSRRHNPLVMVLKGAKALRTSTN